MFTELLKLPEELQKDVLVADIHIDNNVRIVPDYYGKGFAMQGVETIALTLVAWGEVGKKLYAGAIEETEFPVHVGNSPMRLRVHGALQQAKGVYEFNCILLMCGTGR